MKNRDKEFFHKVVFYCWLGIFFVVIYLAFISCSAQKQYPSVKIPYKECKTYKGKYK